MAHLGAWGRRWLPVTEELSIRAELLEEGGDAMWAQFMDELREEHLGASSPATTGWKPSVRGPLQASYEAVVARQAAAG